MAAPKRFFVSEIGEEVTLSGDEFRHAKNVLRLNVGDEVTLLDGKGGEYTAVICAIEKDKIRLHVLQKSEHNREPNAKVYLLCGALKGDKTELVVQKAVELGVEKIGIFSSQYCSAYVNENKLERFNRVSREAAKQCLRSRAPEVVFFEKFEDALRSCAGYDNQLFACEFLQESEKSWGKLSGSTAIVVGSEGGFTEAEFALAKAQGFQGVSLGKRILRAETAAISLLSVVMFLSGEWR